jgi:hypothetical protein
MLFFVAGLLAGALLAAVVSAPIWLPWPASLRWLIAARMPDALDIAAAVSCVPSVLTEVVIVDVTQEAEHTELAVREGVGDSRTALTGAVLTPGLLAALEGWCAAETPLLMWTESANRVHLYGPEACALELELLGRVRS